MNNKEEDGLGCGWSLYVSSIPHMANKNLFLWPFVVNLGGFCSSSLDLGLPPLAWVAWFNGVCQGFHQLWVHLGKTQDEQIEETKLCQNCLPTHPSIIIIIIIISPSHPTSYWSHPIGALIGKYDKTYPSTWLWFNGVCRGFHQLWVHLGKTQDEQIEETKLCQNCLPTHPSTHHHHHLTFPSHTLLISPYWGPYWEIWQNLTQVLDLLSHIPTHLHLLWYTNSLRKH